MSTEPYKGYETDRALKYCERRLADILGMYARAFDESDATAQRLSAQRVIEMVRGDARLRAIFGINKEGTAS